MFYHFHNCKDNPGDLLHLRHWLQFWQGKTWIHDNLCYLTIKSDTGQHSQFVRCFFIFGKNWGIIGCFLCVNLVLWDNLQVFPVCVSTCSLITPLFWRNRKFALCLSFFLFIGELVFVFRWACFYNWKAVANSHILSKHSKTQRQQVRVQKNWKN